MVALQRPDALPPPPDDGMPTRRIKTHSRDKVNFWGNYVQAAAAATHAKFPQRVYADLFAAHGVCEDTQTGQRSWGTAPVSLQVVRPFDIYFFNDEDPAATDALATRARGIGVQGAQVFELKLDADDALPHARDISEVVVPFGPKIIVATGDANVAHSALKVLMRESRRYLCAVIDPPSAIYEWQAFEALAWGEKAMDVLTLFPDEMDIGRGLAYYLREGGGTKPDNYYPPRATWRKVANAIPAHAPAALRSLYEDEMERLLGFRIGQPKTISSELGRALYSLVFGSRNPLGIKIWNDIVRRSRNEQIELPILNA
jgi:three-Cys-motif partner protein